MICCRSQLLALFLALAPLYASAEARRVAVLPVAVYNAPEVEGLAPGLRAMLASRLAIDGRRVDTRDDAAPGEWAVHLAVTRLGQTYSVDAALEPGGARAFETASSPEALLGAIDAVATKLREHLDRALPAAASPAEPPRAPPSLTPSEAAPPELRTLLATAMKQPRMTPPLPGTAASLAVADLDGDGHPEILLLLEQELVAFRDLGGELVRAWASPAPRASRSLILSIGDFDGNGRPEVIVAGIDGTLLVSQALEWSGTALAPKGGRVNAWLRAVDVPGHPPALLGLRAGAGSDLAAPGVRRFEWSGTGYRDAGPASVPSGAGPVNLDYAVLEAGKPPFAVITSQSDRLQLYSPDGALLFESADPVKGSPGVLRGEERSRGYQDEDLLWVHGRTTPWHADGRSPVLLTAVNDAGSSRVFRRSIRYSHGQVVAFHWDGLTLIPVGEGPKLPGYLVDLFLAPGVKGRATLYAVLVQSEGSLISKVTSRVLAYDLAAHAATPGAATDPAFWPRNPAN